MLENIILVFVALFFCVSFSAMSLMADEFYQETRYSQNNYCSFRIQCFDVCYILLPVRIMGYCLGLIYCPSYTNVFFQKIQHRFRQEGRRKRLPKVVKQKRSVMSVFKIVFKCEFF